MGNGWMLVLAAALVLMAAAAYAAGHATPEPRLQYSTAAPW